MSNKKKGKKKKKTATKVFKITLLTVMLIFLLSSVVLGGVVLGMIRTAPELDLKLVTSLNQPTTFYDDEGNLIDEYKTTERRDPVSINEVPDNLKYAFISIEDERFETHNGIDLRRFAGAMFANAKKVITHSGGSLEGASTITQQLIKQRFFLEDSLTNRLNVTRKIQEMYLALKLENRLSKDQILEAYMNTIPLGGNAYGIQAAAEQYFGKNVEDLSLVESAFIAGCAQNPSVSYSVAYQHFLDKEQHQSPRTKAVLGNMYRNGYITKDEYDKAMVEDVKVTKEAYSQTKDNTSAYAITYKFPTGNLNKMDYEWFSRPVIDAVRKDLKENYNYSDDEINKLFAFGGLKIYTTMNKKMQDSVQKIIDDKTDPNKKRPSDYLFPRNSDLTPVQPDLQASAVIMDYHTGEVKTIIGGRGEQGPLSYNRAASENFLRPPGSCIKPLTVYSPAIDTKIATAATIFEDSPIPPEIGKKYAAPGAEPYDPKNSPNITYGYLTLREALMHSVNKVAVKIEDKIGLQTGAAYGEKFGLQLDSVDKTSIAAMSLGQLDSGEYLGTNPLTLATAYGTFGNNGMLTSPRLYTRVQDKNGKTILETKYQSKKVLSPQSAYLMYDLLKGPVSNTGTGPNARFEGMSVRGKTGTASEKRSLWFTGLTPYYSASVWMGNDDNTVVKNAGSNDAARVWREIMKVAHEGLQDKQLERPSGITIAKVSKDSGTLASALTYEDPRGNRAYNELFIDGTVPKTFDNVHVKAKVVKKIVKDSKGNDVEKYVLATEYSDPSKVEERVFITRNYTPKVNLLDQKYVLPTEKDDAQPPKNDDSYLDDILDELLNGNDSKDKKDRKDKKHDTDNDHNNDPIDNTNNENTSPDNVFDFNSGH